MNFMEIIQNLAPDGLSQVEIIRGPEPEIQESDGYQSNSASSSSSDW
jgi:type VI secretion system protein ImpA